MFCDYLLTIFFLFYFSVFSLLITVVFQMLILRDIEKYIGWYAMTVVYLGSGVAGSLGSAIFLPYHVEVSTMAKFPNEQPVLFLCVLNL